MKKNKIQFRLPNQVMSGEVSPEDYIDQLADFLWREMVVDRGVAEWSLVALAERALDRNARCC